MGATYKDPLLQAATNLHNRYPLRENLSENKRKRNRRIHKIIDRSIYELFSLKQIISLITDEMGKTEVDLDIIAYHIENFYIRCAVLDNQIFTLIDKSFQLHGKFSNVLGDKNFKVYCARVLRSLGFREISGIIEKYRKNEKLRRARDIRIDYVHKFRNKLIGDMVYDEYIVSSQKIFVNFMREAFKFMVGKKDFKPIKPSSKFLEK